MVNGEMKIIVLDNFIKNIPIDKKDIVMNAIIKFRSQLAVNDYNPKNIQRGYSVRKIAHNRHNMTIYKFRVNRSDRVLFTYSSELNNFILKESLENLLIFLDYCSHDRQILRGKQINMDSHTRYIWLPDDEQEAEWDNLVDSNYIDFSYNPNTIISRVITVEEMTLMLDSSSSKAKEKAVYYLNDEQFDCIREDVKPLFLFGNAGSGKTTISVYKSIALCRQYDNIAYFTHSKKLAEESRDLFGVVCKQENLYDGYKDKVKFNQLNTYVKNLLSVRSYIEYPEFKAWFYESIANVAAYRKYNFDPLMIWREIRGILKGLFWISGQKYKCNTEFLSNETVSLLCKKNYADIHGNYIEIKSDMLFKIDISRGSNIKHIDLIRNDITKIFAGIEQTIFSCTMLSLEDYLSIPKDYSVFGGDEKRAVYEIALSYERHKKSCGLVDENDMVCEAFRKECGFNQFNYLVTDEVQDLTEKQIYYLYKLSETPVNILFSGDVNQTVSPTFFDEGRISAIFMFRYGFNGFVKKTIESNYRNPLNIVKFTQKLATLKAEKLNCNSNNYREKPLRRHSGKIFFLEQSDSNKKMLLKAVAERHYITLVVIDEKAKKDLKNIRSDITVYTVAEVKGLENDYIVCCNVISELNRYWSNVFADKAEKTYLYSYIFNVLYVSLTRARENICFYEENLPGEFIPYFAESITNIYNFNEKSLLLDRKSTENEFFIKGNELEASGYYEQAEENYIKGGLNADSIEVIRCRALTKREAGQRTEAADMLMNINEYIYAADCYKEAGCFENALKALVYANCTYDEIAEFFLSVSIDPFKLVAGCNFSWVKMFYNIFYNYFKDIYSECREKRRNAKQTMSEINRVIDDTSKEMKSIYDR